MPPKWFKTASNNPRAEGKAETGLLKICVYRWFLWWFVSCCSVSCCCSCYFVLLWAVFGCFGSVLDSLGALLARSMLSWLSWGAQAISCASCSPSLNNPGSYLEPSWHRLGSSEACLEPVFVLGLSWAVLGLSRAVLGLSWAILGLSWACLGPS